MDALHALAAFTLAAALLTITPGLDTALVLRAAAVDGSRTGMRAALGIALGCLVWGTVASVGLGALLAASQAAYAVLRIAGALYVLWLGTRMLVAALRPGSALPDAPAGGSARSWLLRGFLTNILNPKIGIFYVTFLPLFVPAGVNVTAFCLLLAVIHILESFVWFWLLTSLVKPLAAWLRRRSVTRALDGIVGSLLVAFGVGLFLERR